MLQEQKQVHMISISAALALPQLYSFFREQVKFNDGRKHAISTLLAYCGSLLATVDIVDNGETNTVMLAPG